MKHLTRILSAALLAALCLAAPPVQAQFYNYLQGVGAVWWDSGGNENYGYLPPASFNALLTGPLSPPIANNSYPCNTSGGTATPANVCTIPSVYSFAVGSPTSRSLALSTAYQATTSAKPAIVTVNLTSSASLTLTSGTTNSAVVIIGSTSSVAGGTGTQVGVYSNSLTGSLVVGLNVSTTASQTITFALPAGWYFAILQQTGTVTISSAFDQSAG